MRTNFSRRLIGAAVLAGAGTILWFGLGMNRGLLLSNDIKSRCWPWAPTYPANSIAAPALSDPVWQFVPWLEFARRELEAGRLPLWNPHQDGGVPLLANMQSAMGSPVVWPALFLGVARGWNLSLLLRLLLAFAGTYLWLRDAGRSRIASSAGAVGFGLSGAFVAWLEHPQTSTAAAIPLLLLFSGRAARTGDRRNLVGLAFATYLLIAGGHPETQVLAALLVAALAVSSAHKPVALLAPLGGALLGVGLAAPLLLPFFEYFLESEARIGVGRRPFVLPLRDLLRFVRPGVPGSNVIEAAATISVSLLLLLPVGFLRLRRDRDVRFWAVVAALLVAMVYDGPVARALALHTSVYWTRALLLLPLPLLFISSAGLDMLLSRGAAARGPALATLLGACVVVLAGVELLAAARGVHGSTRPEYLFSTTPLLERLRSDREVFRTLPLHTFLPPNTATEYGLDDLRGYDALAPRAWRRRREEIGRFTAAPTQTDLLEPWDLRPSGRGLDAWNVKYLLLHPQFGFGGETLNQKKGLDLVEIYSAPDGRIFENRRVLPRARFVGPGRVRIVDRFATRWTLEVEAAASGSLVVANPFFPGWRARLDGKDARLSIRPGDPIEIRVPPGRHRVDLLYRPASWRLGLGIALLSITVLVSLGRRSVRSGAKPSDASQRARRNDRVPPQKKGER